jgi:hypothetical protein
VRYVHLPGAAVDTALLEDGECFPDFTQDGVLTRDSDAEGGCSAGFKGKVRFHLNYRAWNTWLGRALDLD